MTEMQFTEKQILCGIFECWRDAMGTDRPFDASTRVDLHMKANDEWEDTDLADIFYRLEKHFGFESTLEEWTKELGIAHVPSLEEWENEIAPKFTFGALARFIQKRAVNTVSFEPVMVINKECRPAGVFYGIEQIANQLVSAKCQITPSTNIIDAFRGYRLESFWGELRWRTELGIPELSRTWRLCVSWSCLTAFLGVWIAVAISVGTQNFLYVLIAFAAALSELFVTQLFKYSIDPLPEDLKTFRDLAVWIADHDGDAIRVPANGSPIQN